MHVRKPPDAPLITICSPCTPGGTRVHEPVSDVVSMHHVPRDSATTVAASQIVAPGPSDPPVPAGRAPADYAREIAGMVDGDEVRLREKIVELLGSDTTTVGEAEDGDID